MPKLPLIIPPKHQKSKRIGGKYHGILKILYNLNHGVDLPIQGVDM
jgi:hypothetical protein